MTVQVWWPLATNHCKSACLQRAVLRAIARTCWAGEKLHRPRKFSRAEPQVPLTFVQSRELSEVKQMKTSIRPLVLVPDTGCGTAKTEHGKISLSWFLG